MAGKQKVGGKEKTKTKTSITTRWSKFYHFENPEEPSDSQKI